jgi:hypothetical protein
VQDHHLSKLPVELDDVLSDPIIGDLLAHMFKGHDQGKNLIVLIVVFPLQDVFADGDPGVRGVFVEPGQGEGEGP